MRIRNKSKGIAVHTIVLVIMMGMFAAIAFWLFSVWSGATGVEATRSSCVFKRISYCTDWLSNNYNDEHAEQWGWETTAPTGCGSLDPPINEPTLSECKSLM